MQPLLNDHPDIAEGALFRRGMGGAITEIAEVLEVGHDRMGIPHVRFFAHLMRGNYAASNLEERTLALDSFCSKYKERLHQESSDGNAR